MKSSFNKLLIILIYLITNTISDDKIKDQGFSGDCGQYCDCGPPARPPETTVFLTNKKLLYKKHQIYYENESIVKYKCLDPNNILIGTDTRTCLHGKWTGTIPQCGVNLNNDIRLSSIDLFRNDSLITTVDLSKTQDFYNNGLYSVPYYMKPRHCADWTVKSGAELWLFRLNQFVDINYIQIVLYSKQNLQTILMANRGPALKLMLNQSTGSSIPLPEQFCRLLKQTYKRNYLTLDYDCSTKHTLNTRLESIVLKYKSHELFHSFPISLCDLRVYRLPSNCGSPDLTLSTNGVNQLPDIYQFSCSDKGYMIKGNPQIKCNRNTGKWTGESPVCIPRPYCKLIENVFTKQLIINYEEINALPNGESVVFDGKLAYFQCNHTNNDDMNENKHNSVICRKGQWFGMALLSPCERTSTLHSKGDFQELTDKLTIIVMGIIIGLLIIPTALLMKRTLLKRKSPVIRENMYDDTNNCEQEHIYAEIDYFNYNEKMKCEDKFNSLKSESNSNRNKNIYVETRI